MYKTYAGMAPYILAYYESKRIQVILEPTSGQIKECFDRLGHQINCRNFGRRHGDMVGVNLPLTGEVKTAREADAGAWTNWWWSWWVGHKSEFGPFYEDPHSLSAGVRGWATVIDAQLHWYCWDVNLRAGDLVVERFDAYSRDIEGALAFLKKIGHISDWTIEMAEGGIGIVRNITFLVGKHRTPWEQMKGKAR